MALVKPKDLQHEQAALNKRLKYVQELKESLQQEDRVAYQTVAAYTSIVDDLINEVALEVHRAIKTGADDLLDVAERQQHSQLAAPPPHPTPSGRGLVDVFGNQVPPIALDQVSCPNCGRKVAAGRFAPHLEKCMGRGRQASRNAQRRLSTMEM
ncbi:hypothetical protein N2152v2_000104 [Parachlorella kessleri]